MSRVQTLLIALTVVSSGLVEAQSPQGFGNGRFTEAYSVNLGANYSSMDVAELNQDGIPDMVMVSETLNSLIYLESSAEGVLQISATYDIVYPATFHEVLMIDFDLDGLEDCILLSEDGSLLYMERQAVGFSEVPLTIPGVNFFTGFHAADLDGDGFEDLILTTQPGIAGGGDTHVMASAGNSELTLSPITFPNANVVATTDIGMGWRSGSLPCGIANHHS